MRKVDLFLGVKAEQTLRDAVRAVTEASPDDDSASELCPIGQKDWIAGERLGPLLKFGELEKKRTSTLKALIGLKSHQRIRQDSLRIWAVRQPVPVFKDPVPDTLDEPPQETRAQDDQNKICPVCGETVHSYNIQYDPWGKMVGCYLCRGESKFGDGSPD